MKGIEMLENLPELQLGMAGGRWSKISPSAGCRPPGVQQSELVQPEIWSEPS